MRHQQLSLQFLIACGYFLMTTIVHGQNLNELQTLSKIERVNDLESEPGVPSSPGSMVGGISSYPMDFEWIVTSRGRRCRESNQLDVKDYEDKTRKCLAYQFVGRGTFKCKDCCRKPCDNCKYKPRQEQKKCYSGFKTWQKKCKKACKDKAKG